MVKLSEFPEYLAAVPAAVAGDFATARANLEVLFAKVEPLESPEHSAYLLQLLGDVEARSGNREKALSLYTRAVDVDCFNPLTRLHCAKSLLDHLHSPSLALARLKEAESLLASDAWHPSEDDMSRHWYEREIQSVRRRALRQEP